MSHSDSSKIPDELLALASCNLPNYRRERKDWLDSGLSFSSFQEADQAAVRSIYDSVCRVAALGQQTGEMPAVRKKILDDFEWGSLARQVASLDHAPKQVNDQASETLRDLRNGSVNVVFGLVQLMEAMPGDKRLVEKCCSAARDTAKIMRLLVTDLDPEVRDRDEANKPHEIDHFVEKWKGMQVATSQRKVGVDLVCTFEGSISARCLETSTIDRMTYTLVANASQFTSEDAIRLWIFPTNETTTRWVVQHRPADLSERYPAEVGSDLQILFRQQIEQGNYGFGLHTVAKLISDCFGLDEFGEAIDRGYVGGKILSSGATLWFHWPSN